jgi:glycolate oxidase iron-sulfur subunit
MNIAEPTSAPISRTDLDRCVACGLCLPLCPTYNALQIENASPRGRLSMIRGLLTKQLDPGSELSNHLSSCLQCRRCEFACPAGVEYGRLITAAKENLFEAGFEVTNRKIRLLERLILSRKSRQQTVGKLLAIAAKLRLMTLGRITGIFQLLKLADLASLLPQETIPFLPQALYPAMGKRRGEVALFTGCINSVVDGKTLNATVSVITKLGFDVHIPPAQRCCGALHQHQGEHDVAAGLLVSNIKAFANTAMPIINIASGCGAHLSEYANKDISSRVVDINQFLARLDWLTHHSFKSLPAKVLVQDPCSMRNVLHQEDSVYRLLAKIPELDIQPLAHNETCCGGAGIFPLREPKMARVLRDAKIDAIESEEFDYLVSANIGCALHISGGLRTSNINVLHPVVLIDQQLEN